jgi:hypothetical protein
MATRNVNALPHKLVLEVVCKNLECPLRTSDEEMAQLRVEYPNQQEWHPEWWDHVGYQGTEHRPGYIHDLVGDVESHLNMCKGPLEITQLERQD